MEDPNGALFNLSYQTQVIGDWLEISFTTPVSKVQIEYYDPRLTRNLELRSFIYRWPGDFPVQMMTVRVQKPLNAMDMRLTPNLGEPILEKDNLMYFTRTIENIVKGQPYNLQISYSKDDDSLTYSGGPVQPSEPIISASPDRVVLGHIFPWILGLLGVLLISGGLWYWQSGRTLLRRPKPATHQRRQNDPKAIILPIYCHQCGRRASLGDQFCRACGTRLRNP
jgi:hypothetical protein